MQLEGEEFADEDGEVDRGPDERLVGHDRHGGGAAEEVADGKVEKKRGAVVVKSPRSLDHHHRQTVAKSTWRTFCNKHALLLQVGTPTQCNALQGIMI